MCTGSLSRLSPSVGHTVTKYRAIASRRDVFTGGDLANRPRAHTEAAGPANKTMEAERKTGNLAWMPRRLSGCGLVPQ
jgi:hypothetical protein